MDGPLGKFRILYQQVLMTPMCQSFLAPKVQLQKMFWGQVAQYGHSQSEKKLGVGEKYHRSIKVHT